MNVFRHVTHVNGPGLFFIRNDFRVGRGKGISCLENFIY